MYALDTGNSCRSSNYSSTTEKSTSDANVAGGVGGASTLIAVVTILGVIVEVARRNDYFPYFKYHSGNYVANCDHVMTDKPQLIAMYSQYISSLYVATTSNHRQNLGIIPNSQYYTILLGTCKEGYRLVKAGNHIFTIGGKARS